MIVLMGGNKASGKSTMVQNLVPFFSEHLKSVGYEADVQRSLSKWHERRQENKLLPIKYEINEGFGNIAERLVNLEKKCDLILVDVRGTNSKEFISAGKVADMILIPLESTIKLLETLDELSVQQKMLDNKNIYLFHVKAETNPLIAGERRHFFLSECAKYPQFKVLDSVISARRSFYKTDELGQTVFESKDLKAQNEVETLAKEIIHLLNTDV